MQSVYREVSNKVNLLNKTHWSLNNVWSYIMMRKMTIVYKFKILRIQDKDKNIYSENAEAKIWDKKGNFITKRLPGS